MNNTTNILKKLHLNTKEAKIYLALIKSGPCSVQGISRITSISRSTIYQRLENLKEKGLVIFETGEKGIIIRAVHPARIRRIIRKKVLKAKHLEDEFMNVLPSLINLYQPETTKTKVMHFEGVRGLARMIYDFEMEAENKDLYGYTTNEISSILGKKFIKKYHEKFLKKGYKDHFILSENKENKEYLEKVSSSRLYKAERIFVRTLAQNIFDPKVNVAIYDDKYAISLMKEGKPFGVIIQSAEIADHQMQIFKILWKTARPV